MTVNFTTQDNLSLESLAKLFPTRASRIEMIANCVQNIRKADAAMKGQSQELKDALQEYCLFQGLIACRLFDLNQQEKARAK